MSTYKAHKNAATKSKFSNFKLLTTSALTAAGIIASGHAIAQTSPNALPQGAEVTKGSATYDYNGNNLNITQNNRGVTSADYHGGFNIGKDAGVYVDQRTGDIFVHRDVSDNTSNIEGVFEGSASNIVLNKNGVLITGTARINMHSFAASTADNVTFDGDKATFQDLGDGEININTGAEITVAEGGLAAFVAPTVKNAGVINAKLGKVAFAAGESVTVDLYGDGLFEVEVEGELADAYLENTGEINANGGQVQMTALAAKDIADNIINLDGVVDVSSATQTGGKIILSGGNKGNVHVAGKADASGTDGGSIDVTGQNITIADTAQLNADGGKGADQIGNGGRIDAIAQEHMDFRGELSARGGDKGGNGGDAEVSGLQFLGYQGFADLRAPSGETGTLLMDPAFAVIHSGLLHDPLGQGYVLSAQALANSMEAANIIVQADNYIDVGTKTDAYNTGNAAVDFILNGLVGTGDIDLSTFDYDKLNTNGSPFPWNWTIDNYNGTTAGNITLQSDAVNFNKDVIMGDGNLGIDGNTVNLDSRIFDKDGTTALGDSRLSSNAGTVNVLSNAALIQQGIYLADDAGDATVNVESDTYKEDLIIDKALKLNGNGATLQSNGGANLITVTADDVNIDPFTFDGLGIANYGINANGADNLVVDGNSFTGFVLANVNVTNSKKTRIKNNTMNGAEKGVHGDNALDMHVFDNDISDTTVAGIHIENSNGVGYAGGQNDVDVWSNVVTSADGTGILIQNSDYATIGDHPTNPFESGYGGANKVSGAAAGIVVENSDGAWVSHNIVHDVNGNAVSVQNADSVKILKNDIDDVKAGIYASKLTNALIAQNDVDGTTNGNAIMVKQGDVVNVEDNVIANISRKGIYADSVKNVTISDNTVDATGEEGIFGKNLKDAANIIDGNTVDNTGKDGIAVIDSANTQVTSNKIGTTGGTNNIKGDGVYANNSDGIKISGNTIDETHSTTNNKGNGIQVVASDSANIDDNAIANAGWDGISVIGGNDVTIDDNNVTDSKRTGIYAASLTNSDVTDNNIDGTDQFRGIAINGGDTINVSDNAVNNTALDGILARNVDALTIENNIVGSFLGTIGANGIYVTSSDAAKVKNNIVTAPANNGIQIEDSNRAVINKNYVLNSGENGIDANNSRAIKVNNNTVITSGNDGVHISDSNGAKIGKNTVTGSADDGIDIEGGKNVVVKKNYVLDSGENGIDVVSSKAITISKNIAGFSGNDGINVYDSNTALINKNEVFFSADDGIDIERSKNTVIEDNAVSFSGDNGIDVFKSKGVTIRKNNVDASDSDGIHIRRSDDFAITENKIRNSFDDGIDVKRSDNGSVTDNNVKTSFNDGIVIGNASNVLVADNLSNKNGLAGIELINVDARTVTGNTTNKNDEDGIAVVGGQNIVVSGNTSNDNTLAGISIDSSDDIDINAANILDGNDTGIEINNSTNLEIADNTIANSITAGIAMEDVDLVNILNNDISNSGSFGLLASGPSNGDVTLVGNTFTDNPTGARFESGNIDISDLTDPNSFINTDPLATPVGLQFDEVGIPGSLTIAGNTLGGTIFDGFTNAGSFYARIENGTLLNTITGAPIVIDGLQASFDGFIPASVGGILTLPQLTFLEDRLFDADDLAINGRGQIFVGAVPGLNPEDFIRELGFTQFDTSGLSVTVTGLPSIDGTNLAAIQPAAGGEGQGEPQDLADIEPAAGASEEASCWGDAVNAAAATGTAVNYSFGGSLEESLADATTCQSGI